MDDAQRLSLVNRQITLGSAVDLLRADISQADEAVEVLTEQIVQNGGEADAEPSDDPSTLGRMIRKRAYIQRDQASARDRLAEWEAELARIVAKLAI